MFRFQYIAQSIAGLKLAEQTNPLIVPERLRELVQVKTDMHRNLNNLQFVLSRSTQAKLVFTLEVKGEVYSTRMKESGYNKITVNVTPHLHSIIRIKVKGTYSPLVRKAVETMMRRWLLQIVNAKGEYMEDYYEI